MTDDELAESRRRFELAIERFDHRADTLADSIMALGEKLDRRFAALEERLERRFSETQAMLRSTWKSTT